jgi:hypothetical protein
MDVKQHEELTIIMFNSMKKNEKAKIMATAN